MSFLVEGGDVGVAITLPKWNTRSLYLKPHRSNDLVRVGRLQLKASYCYFSEVHAENIDQLELNFAVSDSMLVMFGLSEKLYPELEEIFLTNPDKVITDIPSITELKGYWQKVNETLQDHFNKMTAAEWLGRHTRVSEEDFAKDPLRNKLNVLISRTVHQGYHLGQLNLLKDN